MDKFILIFLLVTFISHVLIGQVEAYEVVYGDEKYMDLQVAMGGSENGNVKWVLKEKLKSGEYYVVEYAICGKDTIARGVFEKRKKDGIWINWKNKDCINKMSSTKLIDKYKLEENHYEDGELIRTIVFWDNSVNACVETFYKTCRTKLYYNKDGRLKRKRVDYNNADIESYLYNKDEELISKFSGNMLDTSSCIRRIYEGGQLVAKGIMSQISYNGISFNKIHLVDHGSWVYFNLKGNVIAKARLDHGKIIELIEINELEISSEQIRSLILSEPLVLRNSCGR